MIQNWNGMFRISLIWVGDDYLKIVLIKIIYKNKWMIGQAVCALFSLKIAKECWIRRILQFVKMPICLCLLIEWWQLFAVLGIVIAKISWWIIRLRLKLKSLFFFHSGIDLHSKWAIHNLVIFILENSVAFGTYHTNRGQEMLAFSGKFCNYRSTWNRALCSSNYKIYGNLIETFQVFSEVFSSNL